MSFYVGLAEDEFDIRPVFRSLRQHALDQISKLWIIPTGHLWQLFSEPEENLMNLFKLLYTYYFWMITTQKNNTQAEHTNRLHRNQSALVSDSKNYQKNFRLIKLHCGMDTILM